MKLKKHNRKQGGFTLIELSIVLVIIGLIVGGVLVGQDLISAAEVRAQMSQVEKTNTAVNTFRVKYNGLPGDISNASTFGFDDNSTRGGANLGDGDGQIEAAAGDQCGETFWFWGDLSQANLLEGGSIADVASTATACLGGATWANDGTFAPEGRLGGSALVYSDSGLNYFYVGAPSDIGDDGVVDHEAALKNIDAYNIDQKLDDGVPGTGQVQAMDNFGTLSATANDCIAANNTEYGIAGDDANQVECQLRFRAQF